MVPEGEKEVQENGKLTVENHRNLPSIQLPTLLSPTGTVFQL
jgi:hypothetical protein